MPCKGKLRRLRGHSTLLSQHSLVQSAALFSQAHQFMFLTKQSQVTKQFAAISLGQGLKKQGFVLAYPAIGAVLGDVACPPMLYCSVL